MTSPLSPESVAQMVADREAGTPGPWAYRPDPYDDWGVVKAGPCVLCQVRDPEAIDEAVLSSHRRNGTDPWYANASRIARLPDLEAAYLTLAAELAAQTQRAEAAEAQVAGLTAKLGAITEAFGYSAIDLAFLREEHAEWSQRQFGDVSAIGPAKHLSKEALEVASDPTDAIEHADCWMLLWDMQRRAGISDEQLARAIYEKLAVNKARKWPEPKEGEAREHDRAALARLGGVK